MQTVPFPDYRQLATIPHLEILASRIRQAYPTTGKRSNATEWALEQPPYALAAAAKGLLDLLRAEENAIASVTARVEKHSGKIRTLQLGNVESDPMSFAVDFFLDAAGRVHNSVWVYLSKVLRIHVPQSMHDIIKDLNNDKLKFPERITSIILRYWNECGKRLKDYRDLGQHHAIVSSDSRVTIDQYGTAFLYLVLPNNPHERNLSKLEYLDPRIDALDFVLQTYQQLYCFVSSLTHLLLSYTTAPRYEHFAIAFKGPVRMGKVIDGHLVPHSAEVFSGLLEDFEQLNAALDAELPRKDIQPTLVVADRDS